MARVSGRQGALLLGACAGLCACLLPEANKQDGGEATGAIGPSPMDVGCADGTREAYVDEQAFPDVAGCSGGFQVPGVTTPESQAPQCDRMAGNDGSNAVGSGCSVADLCAEGWRVCESADDLGMSSSTGRCPGPEESERPIVAFRSRWARSG